MLIEIPDEYVARMKKLAAQEADGDDPDFEVHEYCGGNIDDAYSRGEEQGEIWAAREFVSFLPKED
jgi:hypothetical protein